MPGPNPYCGPFYKLEPDCCEHPDLRMLKESFVDPGTMLQERHCSHVCQSCSAQWKSIQDIPAGVESEHDSPSATPSRIQSFYLRSK